MPRRGFSFAPDPGLKRRHAARDPSSSGRRSRGPPVGEGRGRRARARARSGFGSTPRASTSSTSITAPASIRSRCRSLRASKAPAWSRRSATASSMSKPGDRVAYAGPIGGYAEERLIDADRLVKLPDDISHRAGRGDDAAGHDRADAAALGVPGRHGRHHPDPRRRRRRRPDHVPVGGGAGRDGHRHRRRPRRRPSSPRAHGCAPSRSSIRKQDFVAEVAAHHRRREAAGGL